MKDLSITFVVAVNDREVSRKNLLASPCLQPPHPHELIFQERYRSAAAAYNDGLARAINEIVVLVHQDVFLPDPWIMQLQSALETLDKTDPSWGVLGCWGMSHSGKGQGHVYTPDPGVIGHSFSEPVPVQTLDELLLVVRKSSNLKFDPQLPGFHMYGTDICLTAANAGFNCYAISAFCVHNAQPYSGFPSDFVRSYNYVKQARHASLPIYTSCVTIARFDGHLHWINFRYLVSRLWNRRTNRGARVEDPRRTMENLKPKCAIPVKDDTR
jgi:hypothetical protein